MSKVNKNTLDFIDKIALTCKNTEVEYRLLNSVQHFTGAEILYYIKNYKVHDHKALCEYIFKHGGIEDIEYLVDTDTGTQVTVYLEEYLRNNPNVRVLEHFKDYFRLTNEDIIHIVLKKGSYSQICNLEFLEDSFLDIDRFNRVLVTVLRKFSNKLILEFTQKYSSYDAYDISVVKEYFEVAQTTTSEAIDILEAYYEVRLEKLESKISDLTH